MIGASVANSRTYIIRHDMALRRFAAVTHKPLILLMRRLFAAHLRWFAAVLATRDFSVCGGSAALVSVFPHTPYTHARARNAAPRDEKGGQLNRPRRTAPAVPHDVLNLAARVGRLAPDRRCPERSGTTSSLGHCVG